MAEKQLTESAWKAFAKGKTYKDSAFVKALSEWGKAEKQTSDKQLEALDEVEKQSDLLVKANKNDKELATYLGDVDKAVGRQRKESQALAKKEAESDDEEDAPDLLTSKMIPLLRLVRKGEVMQTLVASTGKETAVLMMRRAISPSRRKLLTEFMGVSSSKFFKGEVSLGENNIVLFSLETTGGGKLAKGIRQALLEQTGMRVKVKLRAGDTGEEEDDGEEAVDDLADGGEQARQESAAEALARRFAQRYAALEAPTLAALKANGPLVSQLRAVQGFANDKAEAEDYAAALKALDKLEELLGKAGVATPTAQPTATKSENGVDGASAFKARLAAMMPAVQKSLAANGPAAGDLKAKVAAAGVAAQKGEYDAAQALLDDAEELMAKDAGAGMSGVQQAAKWDERIDGVQAQLDRVAKLDPAEAEKIGKVMGLARQRAEAGDHAKALAALDQVMKLIAAFDAKPQGGEGTTGEMGYEGIVAYRQSLIAYRQAASTIRNRIGDLKRAIPEQMPGESDLADDLALALEDYNEEFLDAVDDAINVSENSDHPFNDELVGTLNGYIQEVNGNPLIQHADKNPFGVQMDIADTLGAALAEIRAKLPRRR